MSAATHGQAAAHGQAASPFRQPKAVFAVAFACVVSFMGIGDSEEIDPVVTEARCGRRPRRPGSASAFRRW